MEESIGPANDFGLARFRTLGDASMKAALITQFGGPEVLSLRTVPDPVPGQGEVLVRVGACGVNNVDLQTAARVAISVARVPAYSPHAVAEHAAALMLTLNRRTHRAYNRVREGNFSLAGLVGFDLHGRTAGVIGLGKIGRSAEHEDSPQLQGQLRQVRHLVTVEAK